MKNITLATVLNVIPGLGYIYIGGRKRTFGVILLFAVLIGIIASFDPMLLNEEYMNADFRIWDVISLLSLALTIVAFTYDAYTSAKEHNALIDNVVTK